MHSTNLRRVGGSVMLAVPPALLDLLKLRAGARVDIGIEDGRLIVAPRTRPSYSLDELLAQCDEDAPLDDGDRAWLEAKPVGNELLWCSPVSPRYSSSPAVALRPPATRRPQPILAARGRMAPAGAPGSPGRRHGRADAT